jgi:hypothetical protein
MSSLDRAAYRVRQLRRTLRPRVSEREREAARLLLGPGLFPLFDSMQPADQRHCLDVYQRLARDGNSDPEVLRAALIHDAGKGRIAGARFDAWHRVAYVILESAPHLLDAIAHRNHGLRSLHEHARRTIELAREFGAPPGVVRLLLAMKGDATDPRAAALIAADDAS